MIRAAISQAAGRRHDHLHRDVAAGRRARRDQPLAGLSRLRLRSRRWSRRSPRHMRDGRNQYAPMQGVLALREAIAAKYERLYGRRYDPDTEVTVTSGGDRGDLRRRRRAFVHPGDEVIVLEPCYDSYVPAIELSGGTPVVVPLRYPGLLGGLGRGAARDHAADAADHDQHAAQPDRRGARRRRHARSSQRSSTARDILDRQRRGLRAHHLRRPARTRACARYDELAARSFVIGSFGKTYHTTGWKVGYAVAPAALTAEFRKVHQFVTFSTNTPVAARARRVPGGRTRAGTSSARSTRPSAICSCELMEGSRFRAAALRAAATSS